METKEFPTLAVLSLMSGKVLITPSKSGELDGMYAAASYAAGEPVYTHQLGRVGQELLPVFLTLHPDMKELIEGLSTINKHNVYKRRAAILKDYGSFLTVPKLNKKQHESKEPVSEFVEMRKAAQRKSA